MLENVNIYERNFHMGNRYEEALKKLKKSKQEHIIPIIDKLSENRKDAIIEQILKTDFEELENIYNETKIIDEFNNIEPVTAIDQDKLTRAEISEYTKIGKDAIRKKQLAVAIMAGGQGSRLRT